MRKVGRILQHVGLILPPLAILLQVLPNGLGGQPVLSVGQMLALVLFAILLFYLGRIIEGYARP
jgi:hypothetical protein